MGDATLSISLSNTDAAQWNRELMLAFQVALERNPAADLMSMFPEPYLREHRKAQYNGLSYAGKINYGTLNALYSEFEHDPEVNLLDEFPINYTRRIKMATGPRVDTKPEISAPPEFRKRLDLAETATIVHPLSEEAVALLSQYSTEWLETQSRDAQKSLISALNRLIWDSPKLWESHIRGIVVKCTEEIVAKVVWGNRDYTEYTSLQYLMREAPDIPAPRPHGLIAFGPFRVLFMSYVPEMTLTEAWPNMSHEERQSIQHQLNDIFHRLRSIRQDAGKTLGGVCGEGAKDLRVDERGLFKDISKTKEFDELQFSARHHGSSTYVRLLRSLLEHDRSTLMEKSVFTHGDVRPDNIMVKQDGDRYTVTGIIDWEFSGFYPPYYECTALTRTLSLVDEEDWYLYLPEIIAPSTFPTRWLADRLWTIHLNTT
ncbi:hypothetical protein BO71DRAFT_404391 [Aspergillus ellipticus CBS 707.79]|uniref:Aminoglycoside phosphotransferase domain-containing protein n=1 Tax=Aspergillus ellipticus CBS 707.79 TaxID=1448320 RepID=A0A319CTQ2_9EURO|nr:hypothetical protein BO71DRAFT_404391 [Aspergillus ellipticus CBS 707.79]